MSRLRKHVRQIFADAVRAAEAHGVSVHLEEGGRHQKLIFEGRGTRRVKPIAGSGDHDVAARKCREDVRRILREMAQA